MMMWFMVVIIAMDSGVKYFPNGVYTTMTKCFEAREEFMLSAPRPKINYEAVCIQTDKTGGI